MALFSKEEYLDWRNSPVHEAFLQEMFELIDSAITSLVNTAGENSARDARTSGKIDGLKELTSWEPSIEEEIE